MTTPLPLPKINTKDEYIDTIPSTPPEFFETQSTPVMSESMSLILTNRVRQQYFQFLEKLLADNYENSVCSENDLTLIDIKKCAKYLEFEAVRSCMIVHLYRKSILNIFTEIKNDTLQKKLNVHLSTEQICRRKTRRNVQTQTDPTLSTSRELIQPKPAKRKHLRNMRVQTDSMVNEIPTTLDERIRMFEKQLQVKDRKGTNNFHMKIDTKNRILENKKRRHSLISPSISSSHSSTDADSRIYSYAANEAIKSTNTSVADSSEILTSHICNVDITETDDQIAKELMEMFGDEGDTDIFGEPINLVDKSQIAEQIECTETINNPLKSSQVEFNVDTTIYLNNKTKESHDYNRELRNSIWPCELHFQRLELRKALIKKADEGVRCSEKLKRKFDDLFGPEDNDDDDDNTFAPYSPTIDLDEVLLSSCKTRIAPWIVKHLKIMSEGLSENRFLFKKVAKHIAEEVILRDQHPGERQIKEAILEFFNLHPYIGSVDHVT